MKVINQIQLVPFKGEFNKFGEFEINERFRKALDVCMDMAKWGLSKGKEECWIITLEGYCRSYDSYIGRGFYFYNMWSDVVIVHYRRDLI